MMANGWISQIGRVIGEYLTPHINKARKNLVDYLSVCGIFIYAKFIHNQKKRFDNHARLVLIV